MGIALQLELTACLVKTIAAEARQGFLFGFEDGSSPKPASRAVTPALSASEELPFVEWSLTITRQKGQDVPRHWLKSVHDVLKMLRGMKWSKQRQPIPSLV